MKYARIALWLYLLPAVTTFTFAHLYICDPVPMDDRPKCFIDKMKMSAIDGALWPIYWSTRLVSEASE